MRVFIVGATGGVGNRTAGALVGRGHEVIAMVRRPEQSGELEKQGITMGGKGIRACLTPEQVKSDNIPLTDPQSGCKQEITERTGNQWKFRFSCPKAQGAGVATFLSDREFTTKVNGTFNATGIQQKGSLDTRAVWLGQDCGTVKPRA